MCHLGDFQFGTVINDVAVNFPVYVPCAHVQKMFQDIHLQVELTGHRV